MTQHWQEMLPVDHYEVSSNGLLTPYDQKVITFLYQPLIGSICLSLYMTLWAEIEENRLWSAAKTHHSLMNFMDMNLKHIYEARLKLEGIGLLKTFVKKDDDSRSFIYELQPPLSPEQFFLDGMLNIYLYRKIGKTQYIRLKRYFSDQQKEASDYREVTRAFQDVYESAHPSFLSVDHDMEDALAWQEDQVPIGRHMQDGVHITASRFNMELLLSGLNESLVPKSAFTSKVHDAIEKLSFLYGIDPVQMKNIVLGAVNENGEIDIEELRKAARDWYQFENQDQLPLLVDHVQPNIHRTLEKEPKTKEEKLIYYLETVSPRQLLLDISGGAVPSKADLQIIEDVLFQQKLLPGVVNVLIQYVLLKTDMKLTKGYVEKIASHWARKKVKTVKDAMNLAKQEHRQYIEWANGKKTKNQTRNRKTVRTEMLPDWFEEKEEKKKQMPPDQDLDKKKRNLEEILKQLKQ
ncbi:replication initiation and membrane attachment family protein [Bacillaceae bacterium Marseille-Q3522]|nr:replication initiation and membrane attachment family protein [Bacillaceae bacterium Marseille-Q3522]